MNSGTSTLPRTRERKRIKFINSDIAFKGKLRLYVPGMCPCFCYYCCMCDALFLFELMQFSNFVFFDRPRLVLFFCVIFE